MRSSQRKAALKAAADCKLRAALKATAIARKESAIAHKASSKPETEAQAIAYAVAMKPIAAIELKGVPCDTEDDKYASIVAADSVWAGPPSLQDEPEIVVDESITPLVALFESRHIQIVGTVEDPLFCAMDVATYLNISKFRQRLEHYRKDHGDRYALMADGVDAAGRRQSMWFLTEAGVYKFILESKSELAESFRIYVYEVIKAERKRTVDALRLALKISQKHVKDLRIKKAILQDNQHHLFRKVNDERETVRSVRAEMADLRTLKDELALREHMRDCGRPGAAGE